MGQTAGFAAGSGIVRQPPRERFHGCMVYVIENGPGEDKMEALAKGALRVLSEIEVANEYEAVNFVVTGHNPEYGVR